MSHPDLPYEQAKNKEYLERLEKKLGPNPLVAVERNVIWVDAAVHLQQIARVLHPLIGRVGLDQDDEDLGHSFYIGPRHFDQDGIRVVSWAAPRATELFFQPDPAGSELSRRVAVIRTFTHRSDDVVDLDDEIFKISTPSPFESAPISVPTPQEGRKRGRAAASRSRSSAVGDPSEAYDINGACRVPPSHAPPETTNDDDLVRGMRAHATVLKRLKEPRSGRLSSVLATLQPDQHRLVSWPAEQPLVVQGHPGTGKTVVAVHRAAYLTHPDNGNKQAGRVLLIGPTRDWAFHVEPLVRMIDESTSHPVAVRDVAGCLSEIAGLTSVPAGTPDGIPDEAELTFAGLAQAAAGQLARETKWDPAAGSRQKKVRAIYDRVRQLVAVEPAPASHITLRSVLRPWESAIHERRLLPMLAECGLALFGPAAHPEAFDHVVVDEGQDLTRLEWMIINRLNAGGGWTIVGDVNQRRTDRTYLHWDALLQDLGLERAAQVVIRRGFRSTQQILDYASQILPTGQQELRSLQTGPPVATVRARSRAALVPTVLAEAERLLDAYPAGSVAIIGLEIGIMIPELRAGGWRQTIVGSTILWRRAQQNLALHSPISARGIEFDGVVVVEPDDFPSSLERSGPLYTSLTRANRELSVVYHRALPEKLARPGS